MLLRPGHVFAGYSIVRLLGKGGMGAVYLAEDPELPRQVALKVLDERLGANPRYRALFRREAEVVCRLDHPNVVSVYNRGAEGDCLWIAMQYVPGVDAAELIRREPGGLPPGRAAHIVCAAALGLQHAHDQNLLHRDVKPSNLLVAEGDSGERVLVVDFGLARPVEGTTTVTASGWRDCTPAYAAPEVLTGQSVDHRADVYSLGATLLALLIGANPDPWTPRSNGETTRPSSNGETTQPSSNGAHTRVPPRVPPAFDEVIGRAMATDPDDRFPSCAEFARAVEAASTGETGVRAPRRLVPAAVRAHGIRYAALGGALLLAAVAGAVGVYVMNSDRPQSSLPAAQPSPPPVSKHCHSSIRIPIGPGEYTELPSGAGDRDDPHCIINSGDRGDSVAAVQAALTLCHQIPLTPNQLYDDVTRGSVRRLQAESGALVDGIYGPETRMKALRWPVFRLSDNQFAGRCIPVP
ncbi:serine/threonine-protein kinase [Nocardia transvalensis]|uniref:serine/threonine-protein kinase n=1 Tax=Nocardia transvalensis TaxID=37333 RepID=UPI0018963C1B|nr:serine/threonine-protein kinase [Nocardia transvalensis]MBF6328869.1 protein kinase [Nocardia transvalensis]